MEDSIAPRVPYHRGLMGTDRPGGPARRIAALLGDDGLFGRSIALVILVSTWVATWRPQSDPDFGWHLRVGDLILSSGVIPKADTFSWLTSGQPFLAHSWAWDVVLAATYRSAGLFGTSLVALPVSAITIALIWALLKIVAPTVPPFPRALLVALAIVAGLSVWSPRAQVWDVVFVLASVLAWSLWLRQGRLVALFLVPIIPVLWVNLHGSGALAFVICLMALAVAVPVGNCWGTWPRRPLTPLVLSTVVALAALVVSPNGIDILTLPFNSQVGSPFLSTIHEWQSPHFNDTGFVTLRIILAASALVALGLRGRRRDPLLLLLAAGWTFITLGAARFGLIAGPLIVLALAPAVAGSTRAWLGIGRRSAAAAAIEPGPSRIASGIAIALAVIIGFAGLIQIAPARQSTQLAERFPVAAVGWMVDRGCHGRILNAYDWGGYLLASWTELVATYGSSPGDLVVTEVELEEVRTDVRAWLDGQGVDIVLMPTGGPLDRWLDDADGWTRAYRDGVATIHTRVDTTACSLAADDQVVQLAAQIR